ncbi:flavodoxin family protein [Pectobacterium parmentieri]|uniref:Flavodoxin family protein n=1 Tax=Pectobacterium parmentieri TaxID=1905730 RepID=A0A0H3I9R3_PECPM|nr:NAD(P)H-dependent oxidoreductase [Pectobacterium parmentieri]AFI90677.1 Glutathione-regulated potassium-efflux system ancillary protein kefF [Pectobacterium parmentieri]MBI0552930.1 flavodoxin family protein [Pectobacterium parmentieri]MCL6356708.1 flavodoxin family protein [Pectobacterium parmentieri]MCL6382577.1 flavodoxin family protein [Pectobacterium parmentieri]
MALIILAHPDIENSIANRTIVTELQHGIVDLEIRNIFQLSPDYKINVKEEQSALLRHELIILQYPMYWYNMPAILKVWFDLVFTYQFAYGSKGDKLKDKTLLPSLTVGQPEYNFALGNSSPLMEDLLMPIKMSAEYAQMHYIDPVVLYDTSTVSGHTESNIRYKAEIHSQRLKGIINKSSEYLN